MFQTCCKLAESTFTIFFLQEHDMENDKELNQSIFIIIPPSLSDGNPRESVADNSPTGAPAGPPRFRPSLTAD